MGLVILQLVLVLILRWIGKVYWSQPRHNWPALFQNPLMAIAVVWGALIAFGVNLFLAFAWTDFPWIFLLGSIVAFLFFALPRRLGSPL